MLGHGLGLGTGAPRVLASDTEGQGISLGYCLTVLRALAVGMRELREGGRIRKTGIGVNNGANSLLYR